MSRKILSIAFLLLMAATAMAGDLVWKTDFDAIQEEAKADGKYVLVNFTGSDWCPWCFKLRDEVFTQPEFNDYASEKLLLMVADFPKRKAQPADVKQQNRRLAGEYGIQGFPTVLLLSPEGDIVAKTGYQRGGSANYVSHLKQLIAQYEATKAPKKEKK